jgi:hypothetical protein
MAFPDIEEIKQMVAFFEREDLPQTLDVNECTKIVNMKVFAEGSIGRIRSAYKRKSEGVFYSYYDQMKEVYKILNEKK